MHPDGGAAASGQGDPFAGGFEETDSRGGRTIAAARAGLRPQGLADPPDSYRFERTDGRVAAVIWQDQRFERVD